MTTDALARIQFAISEEAELLEAKQLCVLVYARDTRFPLNEEYVLSVTGPFDSDQLLQATEYGEKSVEELTEADYKVRYVIRSLLLPD